MAAENVRVMVRARPLNQREIKLGSDIMISMSEASTTVLTRNEDKKTWNFDRCYWSCDEKSRAFASQDRVTQDIGSVLIRNSLDGFNGCLFAYGQTGSGKSFSVLGSKDAPGIVPWTIEQIYEERKKLEVDPERELRVWISYLEIYNEHMRDLLAADEEHEDLKVHDHPHFGVYVPGLREEPCETRQQVRNLMDYGAKKRIVASTHMNASSSRSHAVFIVKVNLLSGPKPATGSPDKRKVLISKLNLIDLAGSERQSKAKSEGLALKEGCSINKSLSALGLVIKELSESQTATLSRRRSLKRTASQSEDSNGAGGPTLARRASLPANSGGKEQHVISFRASKLTFLLKDSLAGNSKTCMLATISPAADNLEETVSTLRFAASVKTIKTRATRNLHTKDGLIASLRNELENLKQQLTEAQHHSDDGREEQAKHWEMMCRGYQTQLEAAKVADVARGQVLKKLSLSQDQITSVFGVDKKTPYFLNMSDDATLAGCVLYYIVDGKPQTIGSSKENTMVMSGIGIPERLCCVENRGDSSLTICKTGNEGRVVVDGRALEAGKPHVMRHGSHVVLGRAFALKLFIPTCARASEQATELLLSEMDTEESAVEQSPGWLALQGALQQALQQLPVEQARPLLERAKIVVKACDEANEITQECKPDKKTMFFEPCLLSSGAQSSAGACFSVVARVVNGTEEMYVWTAGQMIERLDRMRDWYHDLQTTGVGSKDVLEDPWCEAHPADIWLRVASLEVLLDEASEERDRLKFRKEQSFSKILFFMMDGRAHASMRLCFDSWHHLAQVHRKAHNVRKLGRADGGAATRRPSAQWKEVMNSSRGRHDVNAEKTPRMMRHSKSSLGSSGKGGTTRTPRRSDSNMFCIPKEEAPSADPSLDLAATSSPEKVVIETPVTEPSNSASLAPHDATSGVSPTSDPLDGEEQMSRQTEEMLSELRKELDAHRAFASKVEADKAVLHSFIARFEALLGSGALSKEDAANAGTQDLVQSARAWVEGSSNHRTESFSAAGSHPQEGADEDGLRLAADRNVVVVDSPSRAAPRTIVNTASSNGPSAPVARLLSSANSPSSSPSLGKMPLRPVVTALLPHSRSASGLPVHSNGMSSTWPTRASSPAAAAKTMRALAQTPFSIEGVSSLGNAIVAPGQAKSVPASASTIAPLTSPSSGVPLASRSRMAVRVGPPVRMSSGSMSPGMPLPAADGSVIIDGSLSARGLTRQASDFAVNAAKSANSRFGVASPRTSLVTPRQITTSAGGVGPLSPRALEILQSTQVPLQTPGDATLLNRRHSGKTLSSFSISPPGSSMVPVPI